MADGYGRGTNLARAALGQGLGLGWGDEAEAWLRSKLGGDDYQRNLERIRSEYGRYVKEHPMESAAAEFTGAAAPALASMLIPGAQPAAPVAGQSGLRAIAKLAALGAGSGAVSGAGSAEQDRLSGALAGGVLGGAVGAALPAALRGGSAALGWLRERAIPTEGSAQKYASRKLSEALGQTGMSPAEMEREIGRLRGMGVPANVANVSPGASDLAEAVAQRTGKGARIIEQKLGEQKAGSRERAYQQVTKGLGHRDYYGDEQKLVSELRASAAPAYEAAYSHGAVDDPVINTILQHPTFQEAYNRGKSIAQSQAMAERLRGGDPGKYAIPEIYKPTGAVDPLTGAPVMELVEVPNVMALDYVKRGLDDLIDAGYKGSSSAGKGQATALRDLRNQFVAAIDRNVPAYREARKMYAGDMEVIDAMRAGLNDFGKLDHEQVQQLVAGMGPAELEAFRTGVVRDLYGRIMDPSGGINVAQRIIGSPEMRQKLEPLFKTPARFDVFKTALEKEAQMFAQANKVLAGSQTGKRAQMRESLESGGEMGQAVADAVRGGFFGSLTNLAARAATGARMTDEMAGKLATMLTAKDPHEVAAVVRFLEEQSAKDAPAAFRAGAVERAGSVGTPAAIWSPPTTGSSAPDIGGPVPGAAGAPDIEADIGDLSGR